MPNRAKYGRLLINTKVYQCVKRSCGALEAVRQSRIGNEDQRTRTKKLTDELEKETWRGGIDLSHGRIDHQLDQADKNNPTYRPGRKKRPSIQKDIKEGGVFPKEERQEQKKMGNTTRKFAKRKRNEDGEQMEQGGAPERTKRTSNGKTGRRNNKMEKAQEEQHAGQKR